MQRYKRTWVNKSKKGWRRRKGEEAKIKLTKLKSKEKKLMKGKNII